MKLLNGDCLELMKEIQDNSVDMILTDLPYGTTNCKWDTPIDLVELWKQYKRIVKTNGAIVLFGQQPFTTTLISSNIKMYRYSYVWVNYPTHKGWGLQQTSRTSLDSLQ